MATHPAHTLDVDSTLAALSLPEKVSLLNGATFWETTQIERDGAILVPSIYLSDGPHGVRKQDETVSSDHVGLGASVPATAFPTLAVLASSWDVDLLAEVGAALGAESRAYGVAVLLGPGANIKRDPRGGRNFEYLSEDPILTGDLAAAIIRGIQSQGVGASLKHFAANNQEADRMRVSVEVDERTLREIYLTGFERAVKAAQPWTVMCSYNKINGVYSADNPWLLTQVLREEWGSDALVVSDWGAVRHHAEAIAAGLDLEMPTTQGKAGEAILAAVAAGELDEAAVDRAAGRVLRLVAKALEGRALQGEAPEPEALFPQHQALARRAAAAGTVLLRNEVVSPPAPGPSGEGGTRLLPLADGEGVVVIGEYARTPHFQGGGSSTINPNRLTTALDALSQAWGHPVPFAPGFTLPSGPETSHGTADLLAEAADLARGARTVLLFLGTHAETEGSDRASIALPPDQLAVLEAVTAVNPNVVVVLANGSPVAMGWRERVPAIVETWLGGQEAGAAIADVLTGNAEPGGRLAETIPLRLEDVPSFGHFPGGLSRVSYGEGIYVGYRHYDLRDAPVAYPFGFGLSYTTFEIDDVEAQVTGSGASTTVTVSARVTNTGDRRGTEVVQVYVGDPEAIVERPIAELKAFRAVHLDPGASERVFFELDSRALAFWHPTLHRWTVEGGEFLISVGRSSRDIADTAVIAAEGEAVARPLDEMSTMQELLDHPATAPVLQPLADQMGPDFFALMSQAPYAAVVGFGMVPFDTEAIDAAIRAERSREG